MHKDKFPFIITAILMSLLAAVLLSGCESLWLASYRAQGSGYGPGKPTDKKGFYTIPPRD